MRVMINHSKNHESASESVIVLRQGSDAFTSIQKSLSHRAYRDDGKPREILVMSASIDACCRRRGAQCGMFSVYRSLSEIRPADENAIYAPNSLAGLKQQSKKWFSHNWSELQATVIDRLVVDIGLELIEERRVSLEGATRAQVTALLMTLYLCGHLNESSLVLLEEPESGMSPAILSAFMTAVESLVEGFSSEIVLTTTSPLVIQRYRHECVSILCADGSERVPNRETFGESYDTLVEKLFNMAEDRKGFIEKLERMHESGMTHGEIEESFTHGLPLRARMILKTLCES